MAGGGVVGDGMADTVPACCARLTAVAARRILVTGASGLLGTWLRATAPGALDVVSLTHRRPVDGPVVVADLRSPDAVDAAFAAARPTTVVHAAYAHDEPSIVHGTAHVCAAARAHGADVVFTSTDVVFAGDGRARAEHAEPDPTIDYGRWKATAERCVLEAGGTVIRLPLLVSLDPPDHVLRRLRESAGDDEPVTWFSDEMRRPAWAAEIAAAIWRITCLPTHARTGCWHLAGAERMSRAELAQRIATGSGDDLPVASAPSPSGSNRPRDLELTDDRARQAIGWAPSPI
jgi:dTDP-4-dehydrorhamnose reductase